MIKEASSWKYTQLLWTPDRDRVEEEGSRAGQTNRGRWVWGPDRRCKETPGTGASEGESRTHCPTSIHQYCWDEYPSLSGVCLHQSDAGLRIFSLSLDD